MAMSKQELLKAKMSKQQVGKTAFEAGKKPVVETKPSSSEMAAALAELQVEADLTSFAEPTRTQGRKGEKTPRMNLAIPKDVYEFVRRQSKKEGMTYSEFFCALARKYQKTLGE